MVGGKTAFDGFLRDQPAWFQDEYLGPMRGKLYRSGGYKVEDFRDDSGKVISIDRLKELDKR